MSFLSNLRSFLLKGLVLAVVLFAAACSSDAATVTATPTADASGSESPDPGGPDSASPDTSAAAASGDAASESTSSTATTTEAAANENWTGPAWLTFPDGFTLTWGEDFVGDNDAFVQGDIADSLSPEAAVAHMREVFLANGYELVRDTPSWIVGVNGADEFVSAGVGTGQPPVLNVSFLTDRNAELQGLTRTLDVMNVDLGDGAPFDVAGTCSEGGEGFSSSDGASFVSISGESGDYSVFATITTPDGVAWSSLGGDLSAVADVGFFLITDMFNDDGDLAQAFVDVACSVG